MILFIVVSVIVGVFLAGRWSAGTPFNDQLEVLQVSYDQLSKEADSLTELHQTEYAIIVELSKGVDSANTIINSIIDTKSDPDSLRSEVMKYLKSNEAND